MGGGGVYETFTRLCKARELYYLQQHRNRFDSSPVVPPASAASRVVDVRADQPSLIHALRKARKELLDESESTHRLAAMDIHPRCRRKQMPCGGVTREMIEQERKALHEDLHMQKKADPRLRPQTMERELVHAKSRLRPVKTPTAPISVPQSLSTSWSFSTSSTSSIGSEPTSHSTWSYVSVEQRPELHRAPAVAHHEREPRLRDCERRPFRRPPARILATVLDMLDYAPWGPFDSDLTCPITGEARAAGGCRPITDDNAASAAPRAYRGRQRPWMPSDVHCFSSQARSRAAGGRIRTLRHDPRVTDIEQFTSSLQQLKKNLRPVPPPREARPLIMRQATASKVARFINEAANRQGLARGHDIREDPVRFASAIRLARSTLRAAPAPPTQARVPISFETILLERCNKRVYQPFDLRASETWPPICAWLLPQDVDRHGPRAAADVANGFVDPDGYGDVQVPNAEEAVSAQGSPKLQAKHAAALVSPFLRARKDQVTVTPLSSTSTSTAASALTVPSSAASTTLSMPDSPTTASTPEFSSMTVASPTFSGSGGYSPNEAQGPTGLTGSKSRTAALFARSPSMTRHRILEIQPPPPKVPAFLLSRHIAGVGPSLGLSPQMIPRKEDKEDKAANVKTGEDRLDDSEHKSKASPVPESSAPSSELPVASAAPLISHAGSLHHASPLRDGPEMMQRTSPPLPQREAPTRPIPLLSSVSTGDPAAAAALGLSSFIDIASESTEPESLKEAEAGTTAATTGAEAVKPKPVAPPRPLHKPSLAKGSESSVEAAAEATRSPRTQETVALSQDIATKQREQPSTMSLQEQESQKGNIQPRQEQRGASPQAVSTSPSSSRAQSQRRESGDIHEISEHYRFDGDEDTMMRHVSAHPSRFPSSHEEMQHAYKAWVAEDDGEAQVPTSLAFENLRTTCEPQPHLREQPTSTAETRGSSSATIPPTSSGELHQSNLVPTAAGSAAGSAGDNAPTPTLTSAQGAQSTPSTASTASAGQHRTSGHAEHTTRSVTSEDAGAEKPHHHQAVATTTGEYAGPASRTGTPITFYLTSVDTKPPQDVVEQAKRVGVEASVKRREQASGSSPTMSAGHLRKISTSSPLRSSPSRESQASAGSAGFGQQRSPSFSSTAEPSSAVSSTQEVSAPASFHRRTETAHGEALTPPPSHPPPRGGLSDTHPAPPTFIPQFEVVSVHATAERVARELELEAQRKGAVSAAHEQTGVSSSTKASQKPAATVTTQHIAPGSASPQDRSSPEHKSGPGSGLVPLSQSQASLSASRKKEDSAQPLQSASPLVSPPSTAKRSVSRHINSRRREIREARKARERSNRLAAVFRARDERRQVHSPTTSTAAAAPSTDVRPAVAEEEATPTVATPATSKQSSTPPVDADEHKQKECTTA